MYEVPKQSLLQRSLATRTQSGVSAGQEGRSLLGGGELRSDGAFVDADLLTADQTLTEGKYVQASEGDPASIAGKSEHLPDDAPGHVIRRQEDPVGRRTLAPRRCTC